MKKTLPLACVLLLYGMTLSAQIAERSAIKASHETPATLQTIYSNLGKKDHLYTCCGFGLFGPAGGSSSFTAMPFTPSSNSHVSEVRVAVQYFSGANQINLSIYADSGGAPGMLLAGPVTVTNLPNQGTCCRLDVASFAPVPVSGGVQYWVVADTPLTGVGSDFNGEWSVAANTTISFAADDGTGWFLDSAVLLPSGVVLGTIP